MASVVEGLGAVTVHVTDLEAARRFYRDVLGLEEAGFSTATSRAVYRIPGSSAGFVAHVMRPDEGGRPPGGASGIVFYHHDPRAAVEEVRRRGGQVTLDPVEVPGPTGTIVRAAVADPDGNEFLLSTGHGGPPRA